MELRLIAVRLNSEYAVEEKRNDLLGTESWARLDLKNDNNVLPPALDSIWEPLWKKTANKHKDNSRDGSVLDIREDREIYISGRGVVYCDDEDSWTVPRWYVYRQEYYKGVGFQLQPALGESKVQILLAALAIMCRTDDLQDIARRCQT